MKKLMYWSKSYLLPLCLLFALALTSCQESEIIPLEESDLAEGKPVIIDDFDPETAIDKIFSGDGEVIGYMDKQFRRRELDGSLVSNSANARDEMSTYDVGVVLYRHSNFVSPVLSIWVNSSYKSYNINNIKNYNTGRHNAITMAVKPGCKVETFSGTNYSGTRRVVGSLYSAEGVYYKSPEYIRSLKINCTYTSYGIGGASKKGDFCGYAWRDNNYSNSSLPIFKNTEIDLTHAQFSSWNSRISSLSTNNQSACDGIMLYDDATNSAGGDYHWADPDTDYPSLGNQGIDNRVSRVLVHSKVAHKFKDVDFPIGAVLYGRSNYAANSALLILPKGYDGKIYQSINSYVISPNTVVEFYRSNSTTSTGIRAAGYKSSESGLYNTGYAKVLSNSNSEDDFFGVAYTGLNFTGAYVPLFADLTFSPQTTIQSIKTYESNEPMVLKIEHNGDYPVRLLGNNNNVPTLSNGPSSGSSFITRKLELTDISALENKDWGHLADLLYNSSQFQYEGCKVQVDRFCNAAYNQCATSVGWLDVEAAALTGEVVSLAAYVTFVREKLGEAAARGFQLAAQRLMSAGYSAQDAFIAFTRAMPARLQAMANWVRIIQPSNISTMENAVRNGEFEANNAALELTPLNGTQTLDLGTDAELGDMGELVIGYDANGQLVMGGDFLDYLAVDAAEESVTILASVDAGLTSVESVGETEFLESLYGAAAGAELASGGTATPVVVIGLAVGAVAVTGYLVYKHLHNNHEAIFHETCGDFRNDCRATQFNHIIRLKPCSECPGDSGQGRCP
ncbi:MAG: hypothetical protein ACJAWV_000159 [Flammeovirgaceae bacterium]|jgi:hypothetical protein